ALDILKLLGKCNNPEFNQGIPDYFKVFCNQMALWLRYFEVRHSKVSSSRMTEGFTVSLTTKKISNLRLN
ncbi:Hypothetical protein FKW44_015505, partial [Caligus rogercresseyi]